MQVSGILLLSCLLCCFFSAIVLLTANKTNVPYFCIHKKRYKTNSLCGSSSACLVPRAGHFLPSFTPKALNTPLDPLLPIFIARSISDNVTSSLSPRGLLDAHTRALPSPLTELFLVCCAGA